MTDSWRKIVDLSLTIDEQLAGATVEPYKSIDVNGWRATMLHLYSHCGTHMDAPCHFLPEGQTIDQLNLEACCGQARIVNLAPVDPAELITIDRFKTALTDPLTPGDRLLLRTDWHYRYPDPEYRNSLPRISLELARWLVDQQVRLVGVEPPSVADVNNPVELTEVHQTLFRGGVVIVEGLANLDRIDSESCQFIALPLRIGAGDGCPVRAIAILPGQRQPPTLDPQFGFDRGEES
jgi:kynurenine formamidase